MTMTVISQHRFDPGLIELRRLIDDGALGRLLLGQAATNGTAASPTTTARRGEVPGPWTAGR